MMRRLRACGTVCCLLAASIALAGCGLIPDPTVRLVTDRAEMAAYVDRFNALQSDVKVEIEYRDSPSQAVIDGVPGDVVVGEWLASPAVMDRFDSLGDQVKPGRIDPSWFYAGLIAMGSRDNRSVLIPMSFSLPAIVFYKPTMQAELSSMFMPLDTLKTLARAFNADGKSGDLAAVGFSPLWNKDFLDAAAVLFGARFRPGRNGLPGWDQEGLARVVEFTRSWLSDVNESAAADDVFTTRNFVQPWYKLLTGRKILFALDSFTKYYALPEEKRRDLDFRWLSQGGTIPVMEDVLFAGVLSSSRNKGGARAFLDWFFGPAVQRSLLDVNQSRRIGVFGVTNGFSSFKSVNEKDLPQKYPFLLGHIPAENLLAFPETLPDNWLRARDEVIRPWIAATAARTEAQPLEKRLDEWLKSTQK
ncbi:MAG TPA: ABC transporter substrate-binding protein [Spirochaetia bacterium]|nr:ABC transporter substrate-binding protein [Spirochaetia bacterium]